MITDIGGRYKGMAATGAHAVMANTYDVKVERCISMRTSTKRLSRLSLLTAVLGQNDKGRRLFPEYHTPHGRVRPRENECKKSLNSVRPSIMKREGIPKSPSISFRIYKRAQSCYIHRINRQPGKLQGPPPSRKSCHPKPKARRGYQNKSKYLKEIKIMIGYVTSHPCRECRKCRTRSRCISQIHSCS